MMISLIPEELEKEERRVGEGTVRDYEVFLDPNCFKSGGH